MTQKKIHEVRLKQIFRDDIYYFLKTYMPSAPPLLFECRREKTTQVRRD